MKKLITSSLLFLLFITTACGQDKTPPGSPTGPHEKAYYIDETDPYFAETTDTFSVYGPSHITRNILQDRNGNIWLSTWEGIIRYDGKIFTNYTLKDRLKHFHVFSVLEDSKGNIWFGTIRGGLYKYDPAIAKEGGPAFTLYTTMDGLADNIIACMAEDKQGNIWFGTDEGLSRYTPGADKAHLFTNFTTDDGLSGNSINAIMQDKTGRIWVGSRSENIDLCYLDPSGDKANGETFTVFKNDDGVAFTNVRSVIEGKDGTIWIGAQNGFFSYDGKSLTNVSERFTGYVFEDKAGNLWTSEDDPQGMALYKYTGNSSEKMTVSAQVFGITEDSNGYIWIGTMGGALRYDPDAVRAKENAFTRFTE